MRSRFLPAIALGFAVLAPLQSEAMSNRKVFFQRDDARPWQNCFSVPIAEAAELIRAGDFPSASTIVIQDVAQTSDSIVMTYANPRGAGSVQAVFQACPFTYEEQSEQISCEVEVQTPRNEEPVTEFSTNELAVHESWEGKYAYDLIDCRKRVIHAVTNSWTQTFSKAEYKLIQTLSARKVPLSPLSSSGGVKRDGSTHPRQNWSAGLDLNFMEKKMHMELCDASVEEISAPKGVDHWAGHRWCPWNLEVVSLKCPNVPAITNPKAKKFRKLDQRSEPVKQFCASQ